jgi:hypothetical protein
VLNNNNRRDVGDFERDDDGVKRGDRDGGEEESNMRMPLNV